MANKRFSSDGEDDLTMKINQMEKMPSPGIQSILDDNTRRQSLKEFDPDKRQTMELNQNKTREQIKVYFITYLGYAFIHFQKEFWSMSKPVIKQQMPELTTAVLSRFDTAQLFTYGICLYICGIIGEKYNQKLVLTVAYGVLALFFLLLSFAGMFQISSQPYFYFVVIMIGAWNALLFPIMISIMGNWFPKKSRGFLVGMWATCTNFGNIIGVQLAAQLLILFDKQWEWLMVVASVLAAGTGIVVWFFLVPEPEMVGVCVEELTDKEALIQTATQKEVFNKVIRHSVHEGEALQQQIRLSQQYQRLSGASATPPTESISFWKAWMLPGVILYSSAFFCTKLAVYCLLLWLPSFVDEELHYSEQDAANLSTVVDIGAIMGSMALGFLSDLMYGKRSPVALLAVLLSMIISYVLTFEFYVIGNVGLFFMMFLLGFFISGLNNMISAACAADLGKQEALKGNTKATSTVTGIIDGSGTMGTAFGQLIVGVSQSKWGWQYGFLLVISIDITITLLPILKIVHKEYQELVKIKYSVDKMALNKQPPRMSQDQQQ